jgi:hypothetical protein
MGDALGVSQMEVSRTLNQIPELEKGLKSTLASGIPHDEVAQRFNLSAQLVWAIGLDAGGHRATAGGERYTDSARHTKFPFGKNG